MTNEIRADMLKVKKMVSEVEIIIGKREGESELVNKLIDAENLLTYCMSRLENAIVPPVRLGSREKVYFSVGCTDVIYDTEVYGIGIDGAGDFVINPKIYPKDVICITGYTLGENLFLTKEEAEKKLNEMRGE